KNESDKIQWLISASVWLALAGSLILCVILFFTSEAIAENIFHEPALTYPLKIFSIAIPFFTLTNVLVSIFLGFGHVQAKVYFQDIFGNALFPPLLLTVILLNLSFIGVFYAYIISLAISCLLLIAYAIKRLPSPKKFTAKPTANANSVTKELLFFSLPLLGISMIQMIIGWTDILMLGYFQTSARVGLYNAALPLAHLIGIPLAALLPIYGPITAGLYAKNSVAEMGRNYAIVTKWIFSATLPLFLLLFLFPE
ncbi:MAG: oligosaccharide flippase family protein, partial [Proteobacteria bacterium]|nr:oligosaccharide flippase family protein [Pseudomonadota bacterium]